MEAIETVYSARDTKTITRAEIRNVQGETGHDGGVFLDGHHPLTIAGEDGLVNTEDDSKSLEALVQPGVDEQLGTGTTSSSHSQASPARSRSSSSAPR